MKQAQRGFTLIELIAVIVTLGIIAATSVPKFVNLQQAARIAKVTSLEGTVLRMRTQVKVACQVTPACVIHSRGQAVFIPPLNQNIQLIKQYPDAGELSRTDQIDDIITTSGFDITSQNGNLTTRWAIPNTTNCYAEYSQSGYLGNLVPLVTKTTTGC